MSDDSPTVRLRYVGGVDEVDVKLPSGRTLLGVQRGHSVDVSASDAKALRDNPNWSVVPPSKQPNPEAVEADSKES